MSRPRASQRLLCCKPHGFKQGKINRRTPRSCRHRCSHQVINASVPAGSSPWIPADKYKVAESFPSASTIYTGNSPARAKRRIVHPAFRTSFSQRATKRP